MIGDRTDMTTRLLTLLPARWFADTAPVRDALVGGLSTGWSLVHDLLVYARRQTRIATATDDWLDMMARDFFGPRVARHLAEVDTDYSARLRRELLRERGTRAAVTAALTDLTGRTPTIFEPAYTADTGAWGQALGYGVGGGWGSVALPFQCFVTAYRPHGSGIANVAGWGSGVGGYGVGAIEYGALVMISGQVIDADIQAAIADVLPVAAIAWTRILS